MMTITERGRDEFEDKDFEEARKRNLDGRSQEDKFKKSFWTKQLLHLL